MRSQDERRRPCPAAEQRFLAAISALPWVPEARPLRHGDHLFRAGTVLETVSVMLAGVVALRRSARGRESTVFLVGPGDIVDDGPLLGLARAPWDAVALTDSEVRNLPVAQLWQTMDTSPDLARLWATLASCRISAYQLRLVELLAGDIRARVASLLLHEAGEDGATALTQQLMAELLGVQRSSVGRVLAEFQRQGIVSRGYGGLQVRDRHALERAARGYVAASISLKDAG
jgi:CRP-like cAMP-binding protein